MFKLATQGLQSSNKQRVQKLLIQSSLPARTIVGRDVGLIHHNKRDDQKYFQDVYTQSDTRLGIVKFNKEHTYNLLTPTHLGEVRRGIESAYMDSQNSTVYISTDKGEQWCNGTDFKTIRSWVQEGQLDKVSNYLEKLYELQTLAAKMNKPAIAVAPGHCFNSGATLLSAMGHPMMTSCSKMAFNECTFGFVPHSGATYYLSRLKGEFGTFLALTGLPIYGQDAKTVGLIENCVKTSKDLDLHIGDFIWNQDPIPFTHNEQYEFKYEQGNSMALGVTSHMDRRRRFEHEMSYNREMRNSHAHMLNNDTAYQVADVKDRVPRLIGEAEDVYTRRLEREQLKNKTEQIGYLDHEFRNGNQGQYDVVNLYKQQMDWVTMNLQTHYEHDNSNMVRNIEVIARCFYPGTLEEIRDRLRNEKGSNFAKKCLDAMSRNSELSMRLALAMLRKAENLDYTSCLQMEVDVSSNLLSRNPEIFDTGVGSVLMTRLKKGEKLHKRPNYAQSDTQVTNVESYFDPQPWSKNICIDTVKYALLPTREYFKRFPDVIRLWINEETSNQEEIRDGFDWAAKNALRGLGVDVRDGALTMKSAREHLYAKLATERRELVEKERMSHFMMDSKLHNEYFDKIRDEFAKFTNKKNFQTKLDSTIEQVFSDAAAMRFHNMCEKSKEAQVLDKRRFFLRLKKFLFQSRCLEYSTESIQTMLKRAENYSYSLPHMTEKWDQNWREVDHPDAHFSPLYYVASAIGKVSLTPVEMTREYLTNPNLREEMTSFTIDEQALLKLQEDIYNDTQKYFRILNKKREETMDPWMTYYYRYRGRQQYRIDLYDYWYHMRNDGYNPVQDLHYQNELEAYQAWMDDLEDKAMDTLKMAVDMLLIKAREKPVTFDSKKKTKRAQLEELHALLNIEAKPKSMKSLKAKKRKQRGLTAKSRSAKEIEGILRKVVSEDDQLKHLFGEEQISSEFESIREIFKAEVWKDLLNLIEIALMDTADNKNASDKAALEKRLNQLLSPQGLDEKLATSHQLHLIDTYLADLNENAAIQEVLNLVKPFFFKQMLIKLKETGDALAKMLTVQDTHNIILLYYFFNKLYPGADKSEALRKYSQYSHLKVQEDMAKTAIPAFSSQFKHRDMMNRWVCHDDLNDWKNRTLEDKASSSLKQTKERLEEFEKFQDSLEKVQQSYKAEIDGQKPVFETGDDDIRKNKVFWTDEEMNEHQVWENQLAEVMKFLHQHKYEIENHFTTLDWLDLYAQVIQEQDIDMNLVLRLETADRQAAFEGNEGLSQENWDILAKEARQMADLYKSIKGFTVDQAVDVESFMASHNPIGQASEASIYQRALSDKNEKIASIAKGNKADRAAIINSNITQLKDLQNAKEGRDKLINKVRKLAILQPKNVQTFISDILDSDTGNVDLEKLADQIGASDSWSMDLTSVMDSNKLINRYKSGNLSAKILETLAETRCDAVSLAEAHILASKDNSLNAFQKSEIQAVIEHVRDQLAPINNDLRKEMTVDNFIFNNHFSDSSAFNNYSSGVLKSKIMDILGDSKRKDLDGAMVDWELAETRTTPSDHKMKKDADTNLYLQATANGKRQSLSLLDDELVIAEREGRRVDELKVVIEDAKRLTELPDDFDQQLSFYQNKFLWALASVSGEESGLKQINDIIEHYQEARMKVCMLNGDFAGKVKNSENGHIYLKALRERVLDELKILQDTEFESLSFNNLAKNRPDAQKYDLDSAYNMQSVNNAHAMGFDNLQERGAASTPSELFEAAHTNVFDKMLADYYLAQRGQAIESNKLFNELTSIFDKKRGIVEPESMATRDLFQNMVEHAHGKTEGRTFDPAMGKKFFDLDVTTQRAIQKGKNGIEEQLAAVSITEENTQGHHLTQIPEYFETYDVRKKPETYIQDKLYEVVIGAFETRRKLEKDMNRRDLIAFDQVLAQYLDKDNVIRVMQKSIEEDYGSVLQGGELLHVANTHIENIKTKHKQIANKGREEWGKVKNEDSMFKSLAFATLRDQERKKKYYSGKYLNLVERQERDFQNNSFEEFYMRHLMFDATRPERHIPDKSAYTFTTEMKPKDTPEPVWKTEDEKIKDYWDDHKLFRENKKEQIDRTELFYILEQFYESTREKQDMDSAAQNHMREYFSNPENTFFYDKNKIV